jgi:hypothetical protein
MSTDELAIESDTGPWAAVPAWVLDSGVSPRAVFLYAILSLYADGGASGNGATTRTRKRLAGRLDCSVDTLDRAVTELEAVGAVAKMPTWDADGDQGPNRWRVVRVRPGGGENAATGSRANAAQKRSRPPKDPDPSKDSSRAVALTLAQIEEAFEKFWSLYPRNTDKGGARKAWQKAVKKAGILAVLAGVQAYARDPNLPEPQFIPHASTWLNNERWNDGPLPARSRAKPTTHLVPSDAVMAADPDYWEEP